MKVDEAKSLHAYLIRKWLDEKKPNPSDGINVLSFQNYLSFAENIRPDCMNFKCRAGPHYQAELWFDNSVGQNWTR